MERYTTFLYWKNDYYDSAIQSNLQIQCSPQQITKGILHRIKKILTFYMETQKTPNSESSLKNNRAGGIRLQTILQSYSDQTQKYRSMELDSKPRDKATHLWPPTLWQWRQEYIMEESCCCSVTKLCASLWDPMDFGTPGSSVLHYLLEFAQIRVHWVRDAI